MSDVAFRYGLFGVGRCGCVHGDVLIGQGQRLVALGDENSLALAKARVRLGVEGAASFTDASAMAGSGLLDAVVISHAQVIVEAAHRSATEGGRDYPVDRSENLDVYERLCRDHHLLDGPAQVKAG